MRLFVTGTDTDVGKTVVTAALARAGRAYGVVVAAKPVASGVPRVDGPAGEGDPGSDAAALGRAAGHPPRVHSAFEAPVSPHRAAALEGRAVQDDVLEWIAALRGDVVLVEGVGGWRVPVRLGPGGDLWVSDLARATGGPVVVVAPDRVGVLNQVLLTVDAVRRDGFGVAAVVLNRGAAPADASRASNEADLRALAGAPVATFDRLEPDAPTPDDDARMVAAGAAVWRVILAAGGGT